jgi:hypothetical protein
VLSISLKLVMTFGEEDRQVAWMREPRRELGGRSALEVMVDGAEGLDRVYRLLSAESAV